MLNRSKATRLLVSAIVVSTVGVGLTACGSSDSAKSSPSEKGSPGTIGVISEQLTNPFFAELEKAEISQAKKLGYKVISAEAKQAGDSATQISAIQQMINEKVKGIIVDPANSTALDPVIAQARQAGIVVVNTNAQLTPASTSDATYATDNVEAGDLVGKWAKATIGSATPHIALLDYDLSSHAAGGRHQGFLKGYGISDNSPEIAGEYLTKADTPTGQTGMENLLAAHPDINVVYAINEPVAQGAAVAIKNKGLTKKITLVSIDGSCTGVQNVANGSVGATVMQFPKKMGQLAVAAIDKYVKTGKKPSGVNNSGTVLITDHPVDGVKSETSAWGLKNCWGGN